MIAQVADESSKIKKSEPVHRNLTAKDFRCRPVGLMTANELFLNQRSPAERVPETRVMKKLLAVLAVVLGLFISSVPGHADTLTFASVTGEMSGGNPIYPYNFNINGSSALTSMMCLNYDRGITLGETWNVNVYSVPTGNKTNAINYRADAWLFSQLGKYSNSDIQYAVWSIFDPADVANNPAFNSQSKQLAATSLLMAQNADLINSGFFTNYQLYLPTSDQTGWTDGQPQGFIAKALTPEPSSLLLMGTGFIGVFFLYRRNAFAS